MFVPVWSPIKPSKHGSVNFPHLAEKQKKNRQTGLSKEETRYQIDQHPSPLSMNNVRKHVVCLLRMRKIIDNDKMRYRYRDK